MTPLAERFASLRALRAGWLDGEGEPFDAARLAEVEAVLGRVVAARALPTPAVFPNPEGTVDAEWRFAGWNLLVRFVCGAPVVAELLASDDRGTLREARVSLADATAEAEVARFVAERRGEGR